MTDTLFSMKESAAYVRVVSRATLYRDMDKGLLSWVQIRSRRFIWKSELDRYLKAAERTRAA